MTNYRLDQGQSGVVTLESGEWMWFPIRVSSLPDNTCVLQHHFFVHTDRSSEAMRRRIGADVDLLSAETVAEFAAEPDERTTRTQQGEYIITPSRAEDPELMWRIRGPGHLRFRTDMHNERRLGDLIHAEIREIIRVG